eukprot:8636787-Alexandrium_andersonii.AAC.1
MSNIPHGSNCPTKGKPFCMCSMSFSSGDCAAFSISPNNRMRLSAMIRSTSGRMERCNSLSAPSSSAARARKCCNARSRARARSAGPIVNPDSTLFQLAA